MTRDAWDALADEIGAALGLQDAEPVAEFVEAVRLYVAPLLDEGTLHPAVERLVAAGTAAIAERERASAAALRRTRVHEAGHAVACLALGVPLVRVTVTPALSTQSYGMVTYVPGCDTASATDRIVVCYAGSEAERLAGFPFDPDPASPDFATAIAAARAAHAEHSEPEEIALLAYCRTRAREVLRRHWPGVLALAAALEHRPTMTGDDAANIVWPALDRQPVPSLLEVA